jgi:DNA-binding NarL/FixJ family response regulator
MTIRILIADDHAMMRDGLTRLLEDDPAFSVIGQASDGLEAVELALAMRPDVVLMDITMPRLNGIDATQRIVEALPGAHVIILSMHVSGEYVQRAMNAGASGYVLKEAAGSELSVAIRSVVDGKAYFNATPGTPIATGATSPDLAPLSAREREVLGFVVNGMTSAEISVRLGLSPKTVETYRSRLMRKLGLDDVPSLVKFAIRHGITSID